MEILGTAIDAETAALLERNGFERETFLRLRERAGRKVDNAVRGRVEPPEPEDVRVLPAAGTAERDALRAKGVAAVRAGRVGVVVLAGGMATRFGGVVKAGVEALDGRSFLDLKVADVRERAREAGAVVPIYAMTSFATDAEVTRLAASLSTAQAPITAFPQMISLRLTPEGELFRDADGTLSPYAPGHGDLTFALRRAGLLRAFRERGGDLLVMSNVDNLGATLEPAVIGAHLEAGAEITAEVVRKEAGDKGGAPARVDEKPQIVEAFRFPAGFDQDRIGVFNTNTFVLDAEAIDRDFELTFFAVEKKVDGRPAIQFERLVGELTAFLPTAFVEVEREGPDGRFQPAKDPEELERRRPLIREILRSRGVLSR